MIIRAALSAQRGRRGEAAGHLGESARRFRGCDMALCAAVADRRLGELLGGPEGAALVGRADAWMAAQAVRRTDCVADLFAPGFPR